MMLMRYKNFIYCGLREGRVECSLWAKKLGKNTKALQVQTYPQGFNITSFGEEYEHSRYPIIASDESNHNISLLLSDENVKNFVPMGHLLGFLHPMLLIFAEVGERRPVGERWVFEVAGNETANSR
jgi:hypothetical protein